MAAPSTLQKFEMGTLGNSYLTRYYCAGTGTEITTAPNAIQSHWIGMTPGGTAVTATSVAATGVITLSTNPTNGVNLYVLRK